MAANYQQTSWEHLRRLGRSPAFASVIFYPLVAGLISFNQSAMTLPFVGHKFELDWSLMSRIYLLYAALLLMFIGSFVFAWRCPGMFKRCENSLEYGKSELSILTHPAFCKNVYGFVSGRLDEHGPEIERITGYSSRLLKKALEQINDEIEHDKATISEAAITEMMLAHWLLMNRSHPYARLVVCATYWAGLFLISVISLISVFEILYHGLRYLLR